jgi:hypothetical protein
MVTTFFLLRAAWPVALTSFNSWQLLSGAVEFPRAFMLCRMNHKNPLLDFAVP